MNPKPPHLADRLLEWFVAPHLLESLQGDLHEEFAYQVGRVGERRARWRYWRDVLGFVRPYVIRRKPNPYPNPTNTDMIRTYFRIAFRNLARNKGYSFINIAGLATGMAVAMLIGLWIWDEVSYDKNHQNYDRIAEVMENQQLGNELVTMASLPFPLAAKLRTNYASDFKYVVATASMSRTLTYRKNLFTKSGYFAEADFLDLLTLKMIQGSRSLAGPASVLLSESVAKALFGGESPINKVVDIGDKQVAKVTGVYEDFPHNSRFYGTAFIAPFAVLLSRQPDLKDMWHSSSFPIYVQLNPASSFEQVSAKIKNALYEGNKDATKPALFLWPMSEWHLYSDFKNGVAAAGRIQFVWLFGIIGGFVLLLACINFMNLSTARSEKRAREVGIRKAVGSVRRQLISQFLSESLLVTLIAFALSFGLVLAVLPWFNRVADKALVIPWVDPWFWLAGVGFSVLTGLIAGSYPAFYLSSFQPVKVLKGTGSSSRFRMGRLATMPRQVLVVMQFTVSVALIIGTIVVFRQIQYAKDRPIGYTRNGLLTLLTDSQGRYDQLRNELLQTGAVVDMAESSNPTTDVWSSANNLDWPGKDPNQQVLFGTVSVTEDFGRTIGWRLKDGRDFSRKLATDSLAFIFNEAAIRQMGLTKPIGKTVRWHDMNFTIIGVVKDIVMHSPFEPVKPVVFMMNKERYMNTITLKLNPNVNASGALTWIEGVFQKYFPTIPFDYQFNDQNYDRKFRSEERIGKLASLFAGLAIFISCLGLFGLASFMAEQRTKEIGVRKVLGATVFNIWTLLSKDFVGLVFIAFVIATPLAYHFLNQWLQQYEYRAEISWWIFGVTGLGAILITLLTVSFQSIKAALMNPVKSLRNE